MKRKIIVLIPYDFIIDFCKLDNQKLLYRFNKNETHISAAFVSYEWGAIKLLLYHKEFEQTPEGMSYQVYTIEEAEKKFPYLFHKTNPILYRKFRKENSFELP